MNFCLQLLLAANLSLPVNFANKTSTAIIFNSNNNNSIKKQVPVTVILNYTDTFIHKNKTVINRIQLVSFAKSLLGIPYKYASKNPAVGFDCSGFINYVYNHFDITVPRSSIDFTNIGKEVSIQNAKPGDLILFTGTDTLKKVVGHIGIVTENIDSLKFIHSSSGRAFGVVITPLNKYYQSRFIKIIDVIY